MNPTIALILQRNSADIEAIVTKVGIPTLLSLLPNFMNILTTVQAPTPAATSQQFLRLWPQSHRLGDTKRVRQFCLIGGFHV